MEAKELKPWLPLVLKDSFAEETHHKKRRIKGIFILRNGSERKKLLRLMADVHKE